ncbi:MAG TPA: DUF308 domain-containing protein [Gemmatimonadaceae bacterium]|jgi:hypothetical protein
MDSRQWDRELAKVDRQLESMSDDALLPSTPGAKPVQPGRPAEKGRVAEEQRKTSTFGVFSRLVLAVALGVAMLFWPYSTRCGVGLFAYLGAALMVIVAGVWTARWTWRHHSGQAHILSLLLIVWGVILGATEVLPRVGYALPDARHPAVWMCE